MDHFLRWALNPRYLELTLLPTEECNFRCTYRYSDSEIAQMSSNVQATLKQFLLKRVPGIQHLVQRRTLQPGGDAMGAVLAAVGTVEQLMRDPRQFEACPAVLKTAVTVAPEPFRLQDLVPPIERRPASDGGRMRLFPPRMMSFVLIGIAGLLAATQVSANTGSAPAQQAAVATKSKSKLWREVAIADIERAHALVREAHPGVLDGDEHFRAWFAEGHRSALALAARANSAERAAAALRFYTAGYRDGHLGDWREQPPAATARWAGWTVQYRNDAYRVVKAAATWPVPTPSIGGVVLSCDGVETGALLAQRVAPFVDRRMELDATRSRLAVHLTNEWAGEPTWDPLRPRRCVVRSASGRTREYALAWSRSNEGLNGLYPRRPEQGVERLASGTYWVHASDFMPSAQVGLDALLDRLGALGDAEAVVFDTRGNGGGNSGIGDRLVRALLKERTPASPSGLVAYWRVSPVARRKLEAHKALLEPLEGPAGPTTKRLAHFLEDLDAAARAGEPFFKQMSPADDEEPPRGAAFRGKLVLVTDEHCASACLDFADLVRSVPHAVHAGASTSADTRYMDIAVEPLPSGAKLALPVKVWRHRPRGDNEPLHPHFPFDGDLTDTPAVRAWAEQAVLPRTQRVQAE